MKRMHRPSPAMTVALIALFVALGGTGYAALKLPRNSVGSKQIKANAVRSSKVKNGSLLAGDFKAGQLPAGAAGQRGLQGIQGVKGDKGDACLPSDPACKGPKGDLGPQGPGALSFDGQFLVDNVIHDIALTNGVLVQITCYTSGNAVGLQVTAPDVAHSFYGWGTQSIDGAPPTEASVGSASGVPDYISFNAGNRAVLDVVARSTLPGEAIKWTRVDILGIRGNKCNYHALIIPAS